MRASVERERGGENRDVGEKREKVRKKEDDMTL
jgi:hypothetical protein